MEYVFTYIDPDTGENKSIKALAESFYKDCIKVKYLANTEDAVCHKCPNRNVNTNTYPMPRCSCVLNPPDVSKYNGPQVFFIPIANLINVSYLTTEKYNGEVRVMLLGISAEIVQAIIIQMSFFDDKYEDSVKKVTLESGKIYDIKYASGKHIYTNRVKVVSIEEVDGCVCSRPGIGYVREHVGCYNSVYVNFNDITKEEFMRANPVKKVKIIVDTSKDFSGVHESIMLDTIRDCTLVENSDSNNGTTNNPTCDCCQYKTCGCNPETCGHCNSSSGGNIDSDILDNAYLEYDVLVIP